MLPSECGGGGPVVLPTSRTSRQQRRCWFWSVLVRTSSGMVHVLLLLLLLQDTECTHALWVSCASHPRSCCVLLACACTISTGECFLLSLQAADEVQPRHANLFTSASTGWHVRITDNIRCPASCGTHVYLHAHRSWAPTYAMQAHRMHHHLAATMLRGKAGTCRHGHHRSWQSQPVVCVSLCVKFAPTLAPHSQHGVHALNENNGVEESVRNAALQCVVLGNASQVHVLLDTLTLTGCLQRLKECAFAAPSTSKGAKGRAGKASQQQSQAAAAEGDDEFEDADEPSGTQSGRTAAAPAASAADVETALCLCVEVLGNLAVACQQVPLRSNREALQAALEGCADLLPCSKAIKAPAGARALGLCTTGMPCRIRAWVYCWQEGLLFVSACSCA